MTTKRKRKHLTVDFSDNAEVFVEEMVDADSFEVKDDRSSTLS
jgi:hypothetical protein